MKKQTVLALAFGIPVLYLTLLVVLEYHDPVGGREMDAFYENLRAAE